MSKVYAMVDCNSFYCSCERLFNPSLHNKPVIVLSNNDGCAVSRTNEAKALGIPMGAPYFKYRQLCEKHDVAVFSSNFALYTNISDRVMHVLRGLALDIEVYSVDEAWLDITGITQDYHEYGKFIKEEVERKVGIPVGVGIAPTKTMAKLANHIAKKSERAQGVVDLTNSNLWEIALSRVNVGDIWGIGKVSAEKLKSLGIKTALDFSNYENEVLIQRLLTKTGLQRKKELQGIQCFELELEVAKKKVIRTSRTFGSPVYEKKTLRESLANYVSSAAEKLRRQQSVCSELAIFIRTSPFKNIPQYSVYRTISLAVPTKDTRKLIKAAWFLLDNCYKGGFEYKKAGIELHNIVDESQAQLDLFYEADTPDDDILMEVIDEVNSWEGPLTIKSMGCGVDNSSWKMLREFKSPRFTSSWREIPKVK